MLAPIVPRPQSVPESRLLRRLRAPHTAPFFPSKAHAGATGHAKADLFASSGLRPRSSLEVLLGPVRADPSVCRGPPAADGHRSFLRTNGVESTLGPQTSQ